LASSGVGCRLSAVGWVVVRIAAGALIAVSCQLSAVSLLTPPRAALSFFDDLINRALHIERPLRQLVVLALDDLLERPDCVLRLHVLAGAAGERLRDEEGLR
jgi:hypothetical protein